MPFPNLSIVPVAFHKMELLARYRNAKTDECLDKLHEIVQSDLLLLHHTGGICKEAYRLANIEAIRAYGARQEEFDNQLATLEKGALSALKKSTPSNKVVAEVVQPTPPQDPITVTTNASQSQNPQDALLQKTIDALGGGGEDNIVKVSGLKTTVNPSRNGARHSTATFSVIESGRTASSIIEQRAARVVASPKVSTKSSVQQNFSSSASSSWSKAEEELSRLLSQLPNS